MTDSFVTQCPHCQTSFRVSHTQLSVARGVVRCGACLQVFNAARQLLEQSARDNATALPASEAVEPPRPAAISQREWKAAELDLDQLDLDGELARLEQREIQPAKLFGHDHAPREESLSASRDDDPHGDSARWPDSLFSNDGEVQEHDEHLEPPIIEREPPLDTEPARHERTEPSLSMNLDALDEPTHPGAHDDHDVHIDKRERLSAAELDDDEDEFLPVAKGHAARHEPGLRDDGLRDLVDDPLQLAWQKQKTPWGRKLLWLLLTLVAALALAGQYVWYHFDELARQDQYRPWFQQACPVLGCKVPSKVDIDRIKSSNLVVRSHPDFNGALVVDAIIYNRASFSQPFPLLELRFADLNGHLIASRRFKPGEYLSGELAGKAEMPPQTPIHIALDILDPGSKAVNYSLSFRSPE
ncbi:MAG: DUF3426 domain-containing protein [Pseudomonas sp.]|nr:DUF3426 domain-containing protein [Pseudomonas sp.]